MADYDFTGKDEPAVLGSYNSYKGKRTTAARKLELLLDLQSKDYSAITSASINDCLKNCERIVKILAAQANWLLANKHAKAKDFIDETTAWVEEVRTYADLSIQVHHKHNVGAAAPVVPPGVAPPRSRCCDQAGPRAPSGQIAERHFNGRVARLAGTVPIILQFVQFTPDDLLATARVPPFQPGNRH